MAKFTFGAYAKHLKETDVRLIGTAVESIRKTVKVQGPRYVQQEIQAITPHIPVDRGTYRRSFRYEDIPGGAIIFNPAKHAAIIELGRRPGARMPPLSVILDWVRRKRIGARIVGPVRLSVGPSARGRRRNARREAVEAQQYWIALQIARRIRARGLPARHVLKLASERLADVVRRDLAKALERGAESPHGRPHD